MQIDCSASPLQEVFQALLSVVAPRPIAWVTTLGPNGIVNLAPFSFFNAFSSNPPVVVFSPTLRRDGTKKDTLRNIETLPEFVVNVAVESLAEKVNLSSKELPPDESEVVLTGLHTTPSNKVKPPRLTESPVNLECVVRQIIPLGNISVSGNLVIGDVVMMHIADSVLDENRRVDPRKLKTIARLGGDYYCRSTDLFEMKRP
jgi:flavin reductase (DIM6/NTAB) family NADH-FMN oxidoreductase RutF